MAPRSPPSRRPSPQYCEVRHCAGVANGTDALELILAGLRIGPGDEVIVPTNTFVATAEAVVAVGATPRFVDVLPDTLLVDPDAVAAAVGPRTAAVIAVHLFGQMADMTALSALAERHGLALVEDAAQAHGARFAGRRAGSWGVAGAFSFYPGKNLGALGDGGAVVSNDSALIDGIRRLADHGRSRVDRYAHEVSGRNSRLDTLQAALLEVKLPRLDAANRARAAAVRALPRGAAGVVRPAGRAPGRRAGVPPRRRPGARPRSRHACARRRRGGLGCALPGALPPAAGVRRVRHRVVAGGRGRRRPHPVAPAPPRADRGTGG